MLNLSRESIKEKDQWEAKNIELPDYDYEELVNNTLENPGWVHFGAGNIFRAFIATLPQALNNEGKADTGIIAAETFDFEIVDKIYKPNDNLSLLVTMHPDGELEKKVVASIAESLVGDPSREDDWEQLKNIFKKESLQMATFTITEKGYGLTNMSGEYFDIVKKDMEAGPDNPTHAMSKVAALAYVRYNNGELPIAFSSMDNCSQNGKKLHDSVETIVSAWVENDLVEEDFLRYINNEEKVTFPWSMIDKITPRPSETVQKELEKIDFANTDVIETSKNTHIAPFVNAEGPEYLVVEDSFPNGRMPLEEAGVIFTDRETVNKVEKMKVTTCLNPLHTALAVYGCLLGHTLVADEMEDEVLSQLVEKIGYQEGLPVVVDPGVLDPGEFIDEVVEERFTNPYIPDTPQRIATDTSQKVAIRFGETIKSYVEREDLDAEDLVFVPLAIAGWIRYLLGVDDQGEEMPLSPDPMLDELTGYVEDIEFGNPDSVGDKLKPILSNEDLMGLNLYEIGLGNKIEGYFKEMIAGKNAVRETLEKYLELD
ncbi:MAG: mannitol dehydrogenase family protein [Halanaerobiales bacterium]